MDFSRIPGYFSKESTKNLTVTQGMSFVMWLLCSLRARVIKGGWGLKDGNTGGQGRTDDNEQKCDNK